MTYQKGQLVEISVRNEWIRGRITRVEYTRGYYNNIHVQTDVAGRYRVSDSPLMIRPLKEEEDK